MIFVCKLPINKVKSYLYSILSLSGQSSGSPYRVRQIMVLIKTVSKTKLPLFYIDKMCGLSDKRAILICNEKYQQKPLTMEFPKTKCIYVTPIIGRIDLSLTLAFVLVQ